MPVTFHGRSEYDRSFKWTNGVDASAAAPVAGKASTSLYSSTEPPIQRKARAPSPIRESISFNEPSSSERRSYNRQDDYFLLGVNDKFSSSLPYRNSVQALKSENGNRYQVNDERLIATDAKILRKMKESEPRANGYDGYERVERRKHHQRQHSHPNHRRDRQHSDNYYEVPNEGYSYGHRRQERIRDFETEEHVPTPDAPRARRKSVSVQTQNPKVLGRKTADAPPPTIKDIKKYRTGSYTAINDHRNVPKSTATEYRKQYAPFVYDASRRRRTRSSSPLRNERTFQVKNESKVQSVHVPRRRFVTEYNDKFQTNLADKVVQNSFLKDSMELKKMVENNRLRNRGTHFSREHVGQLMSDTNELWSAPLDTPIERYEELNDYEDDYVAEGYDDREMRDYYHNENASESQNLNLSQSHLRIPYVDGRLPTPRMQESYTRHHLDRTTPAVGGTILTCPDSIRSNEDVRYSDRVSRRIDGIEKKKRFVTFNQPFAGKSTQDDFDIVDENLSYDVPAKFTEEKHRSSFEKFGAGRHSDKVESSSSKSSKSSRSSKSSKSSTTRSSTSSTNRSKDRVINLRY